MSKLKHALVALVALTVFMATPAFAASSCKTGKFVGSYTQTTIFHDIWGNGTGVDHAAVSQLTFSSDGTVIEEFSGAPDLMLSGALSTPQVGSWQCRHDGMVVVTAINAVYFGTDISSHGIPNVPVDLFLTYHSRTTRLFSVTDENTLTRVQSRARIYDPAQDPTDPTGGTLFPLKTNSVEYKRLVASDADLLLP